MRKCAYCDFASYSGRDNGDIDKYILALTDEIRSYHREEKIRLDTVYFGGGTPSLLSPLQLETILNEVRLTFDVLPDAEITMEMNPGTVSLVNLAGYRALGVNRASLGIQSFSENELKKLGRIHSPEDAHAAFSMLRDAGFDNISVDLMYGIPHQTVDSLTKTLDLVLALNPEHISAYGLIIEEGTPFFDLQNSLPLPDDDTECDMYYLISGRLSEEGYIHYEISNYSKPGYSSRHNLKYWRDEEYFGVGVSAYSYFDGARFGNTRSLAEYLSGVRCVDRELVDRKGQMYEYAMMRLRLREGISLSEYESLFGVSFISGREKLIKDYSDLGLLTLLGDRLAFTERGFYVSNTLLANLL